MMKYLGRCLMNNIRLYEGGRGSCLNEMPKKTSAHFLERLQNCPDENERQIQGSEYYHSKLL